MNTSFINCLGKPVALSEFGSDTHPAVLAIHGNSVHSFFLKPLISLLEPKYHIITLDLPGHNQSEAWEKEDYNRENLAFLFNSVLNYFKIEEVNAFGFSMGGFILLESFDLVPAIKKLAIAGHPPLKSVSDMQEAYYINEDSGLFLQGILTDDEIERLYNSVIRINDENVKKEIKESIRNTSPSFREGCMNMAIHASDQINKLNQFEGPLTIIHAADDLAVKSGYLQNLQLQNLWEHKIQLIPESGHFCMLEKPVELANILDRFFMSN